jgi:hypothetical protein
LLAVESANNYLGVSFTANCNDSNGSYLVLKKSRGTIAGSTTVVQSGDEIGNIFFEATDGSASRSAAAVRAFVDGTPGANDMPGRLVFSTTADGASSPTERLRITSAGLVGIGTSLPPQQLSVHSASTTDGRIEAHGIIARDNWGSASGLGNGMFSPTSNTLAFTTNSTERMRLDSSGRVGIGTTAPTEKLHIHSTGNNPAYLHSTNDGTGTGATDGIVIGMGDATNAYLWNYENGGIVFATNATQRAVIDSSGRLLVGTSTGTSRLSIAGTADNANSEIQITATGVASGYIGANSNGLNIGTDTAGLVFKTGVAGGGSVGASGTERMRIDSSGRLLIGTSTGIAPNESPGSGKVLQIAGTAAGQDVGIGVYNYSPAGWAPNIQLGQSHGGTTGTHAAVVDGGILGSIAFAGSDGTKFVRGALIQAVADGGVSTDDLPTRLVFSTTADGASSPGEAMRIPSGKNVLLSGCASDTLTVTNTSGAGTTSTLIVGRYSNSVGTTNGPACLLVYTNGNVVNTNNSYGAISDLKLKENIVDANSQWDDLKALQVRNYNFKEGQTHTQIGLVAQEAELVSPGLVSESPDRDEDGNDLGTVTKSVNYSVLYMKAVKALQEAIAKIETLEGMVAVNNITIDEQQHQLSTLAARLTALENA